MRVVNVAPGFFVAYVDVVPPEIVRNAVATTLLGSEADDLVKYQISQEIRGGWIIVATAPCGCHSVVLVFERVSSEDDDVEF